MPSESERLDPWRVEEFFDPGTGSVSYLVFNREGGECAVLDSVLEFDLKSGRTSTVQADRIISRIRELELQLQWILETHVHADHLSAASYLKEILGGAIGIGSRVIEVQRTFGKVFNLGIEFPRDGSQFDRLFEDGERFRIGGCPARVMYTPGHTPACVTYVVGDGSRSCAFVGDTLFAPDIGTGRCDFPGGDARALYRSIQRILELPAETQLCLCHDYRSDNRTPRCFATVGEQRERNIHIGSGVDEDAFVKMRRKRDALLDAPTLLLPSVQINMRAGRFPPPERNGISYLRIPIDALR